MSKLRPDPSWHYRRRAVALTLLSSFGLIAYSMSLSVAMASAVVGPLSGLAGAALGFYVGGAAYERSKGVPSLSRYEDDKTN